VKYAYKYVLFHYLCIFNCAHKHNVKFDEVKNRIHYWWEHQVWIKLQLTGTRQKKLVAYDITEMSIPKFNLNLLAGNENARTTEH
jgi:predicted CDP-diglyceride synthetase/phosphatidate cytidylyltransferase